MIRFCPNCLTERPVAELFCEGVVEERPCQWQLTDEPVRPTGYRPASVVTVDHFHHGPAPTIASALCINGHPVQEEDLMCLTCGGDRASEERAFAPEPALPEADAEALLTPAQQETVVEGWCLLRQISATPHVSNQYLAANEADGRRGLLTLYHHGAEPDPSVYGVLARLPAEDVTTILATGRWDGRAFEVVEEMPGSSLAELGYLGSDLESVHALLAELGRTLDAFSEAGLRHRDIRPATLFVRSREPLELVIGGFGSARLSEFDLDIASPLQITRYMAPEAVVGGVAPASDWWSLGMVLLEQVTRGACFDGINEHAYLIHMLANGVALPQDLDPRLVVLFRGLLARDRHDRWQWTQVRAWLSGEDVAAPEATSRVVEQNSGTSIELAGKSYRNPALYALAAAEPTHWEQAREQLLRGVLVTWAQGAKVDTRTLAALRQLAQNTLLDEDFRLMLALKILNPEMPLIHRGAIVTPRWLLEHPLEGYELISGQSPEVLERLGTEAWISQLKERALSVRRRAKHLSVDVNEDLLRVYLLATSRTHLVSQWGDRRRLFPDTEHPGLQGIAERGTISEEDLIVLLSAAPGSFKSVDAVLAESRRLAAEAKVTTFDLDAARTQAARPCLELIRELDDRTAGFARSPYAMVNEWLDRFRLERRLSLARMLVLLSVQRNEWQEPHKQQYVAQILDFFEKRVSTSVLRGPLVRMSIGKNTARVDLYEVGSHRVPAAALLDHLLQRSQTAITLDPAILATAPGVEQRLRSLSRQTNLYKRDTGIDGLYLAFPFLLVRDRRTTLNTRIAPLLLWPVELRLETGTRGAASLAFDREREEVRVNPALDALVGSEAAKSWRQAADDLLCRSSFKAAEVMDAFGLLSPSRGRRLDRLPGLATTIPAGTQELDCSAVLFHLTFVGQAIGEDLRNLKPLPPTGTGLETALRLQTHGRLAELESEPQGAAPPRELDRYFTVASDPSQEAAVFQARQAPGLLIEGPPGTGKSQTIVNIVGDAIGRRQSLLIICQKHAALQVVHKRLVAEGLGNRVVMVNDVNKDRLPIVKAVRQQLEELFRKGRVDPLAAVRRKREATATRIETLESELDKHHAALHAINERIGLSYRALLGELITLEVPGPPLDVPSLRVCLQKLTTSELAQLEEQVSTLARHWLPARYEGSALAALLPFSADRATLADFNATFVRFVEAERARTGVLAAHPCEFELDDPASLETWLAVDQERFLGLADAERRCLAAWLPLFRPMHEDAKGFRLLTDLKKLVAALEGCPGAQHDRALSPILTTVDTRRLETIVKTAIELSAPASWWASLSPSRYVRTRALRTFLVAHQDDFNAERIQALGRAGELEQAVRPLRAAISKIFEQLGLGAVVGEGALDVVNQARGALHALSDCAALARRLAAAPLGDRLDAAALMGTRQAFQDLFAAFQSVFARHRARRASGTALQPLTSWFSAGFLADAQARIQQNRPSDTDLEPILMALPSLGAYQQFRGRAARLSADAVAVFAVLRRKEAELETIPAEALDCEVRRILNREARLGWKQLLEEADPDLLLERAELVAKAKNLAEVDLEMRGLNRQLLQDDVDITNVRRLSDWEDITRLTGQRARRLREFIELGASLGLMKLRPIWLMNPDVASRVLPLKPALFDSVIYDEASQLPVEYALPTLFRGRVSVVSGDEKQMPPTSFFASRGENEQAEAFDGSAPDNDASDQEREGFEETWNRREIKDCPDLLQLARSNLPNTTLQIHYRSAYRELIGYSNASFYRNQLNVPVRHPEATVRLARPIEVIRVDGMYEGQTNPGEAKRVVDVLAEFWRKPRAERPTIGVVTFNLKQAALVEEMIEERAESDPVFCEALSNEREHEEDGEDMGVFVKNVENVQGDERDVIVFSSTFGRNSQGSFRRNFGVLGQQGGERRLNVAVTRARKKIILITSIPIAEVSHMLGTQRPPATPRDFLQGYLEYARAVSAGEFDNSRAVLKRMLPERERPMQGGRPCFNDGFSTSVAEFVSSLGWRVTSSFQEDAFGLDFAIENSKTGLFAIGIECDAPRHELLEHARAREVWRPGVLRKAIPRIHRVSCHAWYHSPDGERSRLRDAIQASFHDEGFA